MDVPPSRARLLVVDDEPTMRDAYRSFFAAAPDLVVAGEARDGAEAVELYAALCPDLVLMDLQMPVKSGVDATQEICRRWPGAVVVVSTTFGTRSHVVAALRAGAAGYLLKGIDGPALVAGLQQALRGEMPLSSAVRRELVASVRQEADPAQDHDLTPREVELVGWLAHGLTNAQIGRRMHLSEGSVKQYVTRVASKLQASSRTQVLVRSIQLGVVDPHALPPLTP